MIRWTIWLACAALLWAQKPENVLVVVNDNVPVSRTIAEYYVLKRAIPLANVCRLSAPSTEHISRAEYDKTIAAPIAVYLRSHHLQDRIFYIVTTLGVPLRIDGASGRDLGTDAASVDSELTLLYSEMKGLRNPLNGSVPNPFFSAMTARFEHPKFSIYLVTRLAGYDFADVKAIVDRALTAANVGKFVIDLKALSSDNGNDWLRQAASSLPANRVVLDDSAKVISGLPGVIGYASWGSNDPSQKQRHLKFGWLPGAIATEFVSTDARTFLRPPDNWNLGAWNNPQSFFAGSPQSMTADYIHDGATGASGHVEEPYLPFCPRPQFLLPAYYRGRNLAESYYLAIPALSWMNVVIGDPLCSLGKPH